MTTPGQKKFSIVSLGCARNLVDSEVMAGILQKANYLLVQEPADADVVMVNTCGFIGAAKEESLLVGPEPGSAADPQAARR